MGIPLLPAVELGGATDLDYEAAVKAPSTELALDLEGLLLANDPAEARTTAVSADALAELSARRR